MTRGALAGAAVALVVGIGSLSWWLWPRPPQPAAPDDDTGLTQDEQRALLQEIGYLK